METTKQKIVRKKRIIEEKKSMPYDPVQTELEVNQLADFIEMKWKTKIPKDSNKTLYTKACWVLSQLNKQIQASESLTDSPDYRALVNKSLELKSKLNLIKG